MTLIARFTVDSFEPRQVTGLEADWFGLLTFAKTFTSGITGQGTTVFMSAGTEEGSVVRGHRADHRPPRRRPRRVGDRPARRPGVGPGILVRPYRAGHRTGAFAGWTGSARIVHDDQGAYFEIDLG